MRTMKIVFLILTIFLTVFTSITGCSSAVSAVPESGQPAPDFTYPGADGKTVALSDLKGKAVVINFWATWCGPCRQEMPLLDTLAKDEEKAAQGLVFLSINVGESKDTVQTYMKTNGYSFPVILDGNNTIASKYNIRYIPTTYFIGRDGVIRSLKTGAFLSQSELLKMLDDIMK